MELCQLEESWTGYVVVQAYITVHHNKGQVGLLHMG